MCVYYWYGQICYRTVDDNMAISKSLLYCSSYWRLLHFTVALTVILALLFLIKNRNLPVMAGQMVPCRTIHDRIYGRPITTISTENCAKIVRLQLVWKIVIKTFCANSKFYFNFYCPVPCWYPRNRPAVHGCSLAGYRSYILKDSITRTFVAIKLENTMGFVNKFMSRFFIDWSQF